MVILIKNEIENLVNRIPIDFTSEIDEKDVKKISFILENYIPFEEPDGYYYDHVNNIIYLLEHFEFDTSRNTRHGSDLRRNIKAVNTEVNKEVNEASVYLETSKVIEQAPYEIINGTINYKVYGNGAYHRDNYINNLTKVYNNHANKITKYKSKILNILNLDESSVKFEVFFIIEEKSLHGVRYLQGKKPLAPVVPFFTTEFYNLVVENDISNFVYYGYGLNGLQITNKEKIIRYYLTNNLISLKNNELFVFPAPIYHTAVIKNK